MNRPSSGSGPPAGPSPHPRPPPLVQRRMRRLGPRRIGRSAARVHGVATWISTSEYAAEKLQQISQTTQRLQVVSRHCPNRRSCRTVERLLNEAAVSLARELPESLPFLVSSKSSPRRLRVAAVMREWLLTSRRPCRADHLRRFLLAYQEVSPLCLIEVRLLPIGLQLAILEKCRILPSPENSTHLELLPRLIAELALTCRFAERTDWKKLSEEVSQIHFLLNRDPSQAYGQGNFGTRDAYGKSHRSKPSLPVFSSQL